MFQFPNDNALMREHMREILRPCACGTNFVHLPASACLRDLPVYVCVYFSEIEGVCVCSKSEVECAHECLTKIASARARVCVCVCVIIFL
jgi:hypothetical protein